jgi:hypothetical protein
VSTACIGSLHMTVVSKHFHTKIVKIFKYIYTVYEISQSMITAIKRKSKYTKAFYALVVFL